jgi:hypothetical protein
MTMSERSDKLKQDLGGILGEWAYGDEGRTLLAPTKVDKEAVLKMAEEVPLDDLAADVGVVLAEFICTNIEQLGLRPADYWKTDLPVILAKRLAKALTNPTPEFASFVQGNIRGRG